MRKVLTVSLALFFFNLAFSQREESIDKFAFIDSAAKLIRMVGFKGYTVRQLRTRIILTKTDSIRIATSYAEYRSDKPSSAFASIKYKYELYIDFVEKELAFNRSLNKTVNDSIDKIICSFSKKKYGKGEYYTHMEAIELLQKMKIRENPSLNNFDIRYSDNCPPEWIPYEWNDVKLAPAEPPSRFQKNVDVMKRKIAEMLEEWGI